MRLVYLSPVRWNSFAQRSQHFVRWFHHKTGAGVLWVEPYPTRFPILSDLIHRPPGEQTSGKVPDWLEILTPPAIPIEPLPGSGLIHSRLWRNTIDAIKFFVAGSDFLVGIGKPSELALQVLSCLDGFSFYDAMDDFPAFYSGLSRMSMRRREELLFNNVNAVLASSTALFARMKSQHQTVLMALNASDLSSLPPASECVATPKPLIIGYVGTIAGWFDWSLVVSLANAVQDVSIRLIGPLHSRPPLNLPSNIQLLPACSHAEAMNAMRQFGVGLIPFRENELTASVDPIKYYEYRALGLPVLSTPFGEMAHRQTEQGVFIMDKTTDLAKTVALAFADKSTPEQIDLFRLKNSWQSRFDASGLLQRTGCQ